MNIKTIGPNMTQLDLSDGTQVLVSYGTPVAAFVPGIGYARTDRKWSQTTSRHISKWLQGADSKVMAQDFFDKWTVIR